jgi:hypothetical protein
MSRRRARSIGARPRCMTIDKAMLDPGEELLWSGRPNPTWFALGRGWKPLLFAVFVLIALVSSWTSPQLQKLPPHSDPKLGHVLLIFEGFWAVAGVLGICSLLVVLWFWLRALRTTYTLTSRRVLIDTVGPLPRRFSVPLEHLRFVEVRSKLLGPGDLVFNETGRASLDGWGVRGEGFIAIPDASHVEELMRAAIEKTFSTRTRGPWQ